MCGSTYGLGGQIGRPERRALEPAFGDARPVLAGRAFCDTCYGSSAVTRSRIGAGREIGCARPDRQL